MKPVDIMLYNIICFVAGFESVL